MLDNTLIDVLEDELGFKLTSKNLDKRRLPNSLLEKIAFKVENFYNNANFKIISKSNNELRPFISPSFKYSFDYGMDLALANNSIESQFSENLKKILLYSHSVSFLDPLPYQLDFFRLNPEGETAKRHYEIVIDILKFYAELRGLFKNGIIVPISDTVFKSNLSDDYIHDEERDFYAEIIPKYKGEYLSPIFSILKKEIKRQTELNSNINLFLSDVEDVKAYKAILEYKLQKYISRDIKEPLNCSQLASISSINTSGIKVNDIISIRKNEEVFNQWRLFVDDLLKEFNTNASFSNDRNLEFKYFMERNKMIEEKLKLTSKKTTIIETSKKFFIGGVSGILTGIVTNNIETSLIGAGIPLLIEQSLSILKQTNKTKLLRNHYLCLK